MKYLGLFVAIIAFHCTVAIPGLLDGLLGGVSNLLISLLGGGNSDRVQETKNEFQEIISRANSFRPPVPNVVDAIKNVESIALLAITLVSKLTEVAIDNAVDVDKLNENYNYLRAFTETIGETVREVIQSVLAVQPQLSTSGYKNLNKIMGSVITVAGDVNMAIANSQFQLVTRGLGECNLTKEFTLVEDLMNWYGAELHCKSLGMELASIESQEEQDKLTNLIKNSGLSLPYFWLGAYDLNSPGTFSWVASGEPISSTLANNWQPTDPNNPGSCLEMFAVEPNYGWVDEYCDRQMRSVCQLVHC